MKKINWKLTPNKILLGTLGLLLILSLSLLYILHVNSFLINTIQIVGKDTIPSIVAAEQIKINIADANSYAINAFLENEKGNGKNRKIYREYMSKVSSELVSASQNITYGDEEKTPILEIAKGLNEYQYILGFSELQSEDNYLKNILQAQTLLDEKIIPASTRLNEANFSHLMNQYNSFKNSFIIQKTIVNILMCSILILFIGMQIYLFKKTNRVFNLPILIASILIVSFTVYLNLTFVSTSEYLKIAKEDAFDSIHSLVKAKAISYDANAIESLYLLAKGNDSLQKKLTEKFNNDVNLLIDIPINNALNLAKNHKNFGGLLGEELSNITFENEESSAIETLESFINYVKIDKNIRYLEESNQHAQAVILNLGIKEGESNWAFDKFDKNLDKTIQINQLQFDKNIEKSFKEIKYINLISIILFLLVSIGLIFGIKQRLNEYSF